MKSGLPVVLCVIIAVLGAALVVFRDTPSKLVIVNATPSTLTQVSLTIVSSSSTPFVASFTDLPPGGSAVFAGRGDLFVTSGVAELRSGEAVRAESLGKCPSKGRRVIEVQASGMRMVKE